MSRYSPAASRGPGQSTMAPIQPRGESTGAMARAASKSKDKRIHAHPSHLRARRTGRSVTP